MNTSNLRKVIVLALSAAWGCSGTSFSTRDDVAGDAGGVSIVFPAPAEDGGASGRATAEHDAAPDTNAPVAHDAGSDARPEGDARTPVDGAHAADVADASAARDVQAVPACDSGTTCSGVCVDEQTDMGNCGACGNACPAVAACQSGTCTCPVVGQLICGGACVDAQSDMGNCGACGNACPVEETCSNGSCGCPVAGQAFCGGACVDTQTDLGNCGSCGAVCAGSCSEGTCLVTLAYDQDEPNALVVAAGNVYWTDTGSGNIMAVSTAGGGVPSTLATNLSMEITAFPASLQPNAIVAEGGNVLWTNFGVKAMFPMGTVMSIPLGGGTPTTLVSELYGAHAFAINGGDMFWSSNVSGNGTVMMQSLSGGTTVNLGSGDATCLAASATNVYMTTDGMVVSIAIHGGEQTVIQGDNEGAVGIAVDANNVYWANGLGTIMSAPLAGGTPTMLATGDGGPSGIAIDATSVYWTNYDEGTIMSVPLAGGTPTTLAQGQGAPVAITVDATSVYWTDYTGGFVMKLSPK